MKLLIKIIDIFLNNLLAIPLLFASFGVAFYFCIIKPNENIWLFSDLELTTYYFSMVYFTYTYVIYTSIIKKSNCFHTKILGKIRFCNLTKRYVLEKIGLKNIEVLEKLSYTELKKIIYDFETIMMIEKNEIISEEQKLSLKEKLINSKDNPRKIRKICMSEIEEMENEYKKVENEVNKRYNEAFLEKSRKMLKETIENSK